MTILGRQMLGKGAFLLLVEVEGRTLLLGTTPQSISLLAELDSTGPGAASADGGSVHLAEIESLYPDGGAMAGGLGGPKGVWIADAIEHLREMTVRR